MLAVVASPFASADGRGPDPQIPIVHAWCYPELVADGVTPEMLAMLERQRAHFASDEFLVERANDLRGASPTVCWEATKELCASLDWFVARMEPEVRARALAPEPLSRDLVEILEAMQKQAA